MRGGRVAACVALAALAAVATGVVLAQGGQAGGRGRSVPPDVRAAAERGLPELLGPDDGRGLDRLGFRNRAEASAASIGEGFQVFTVPPDLLAASESADISSVATPSTQWLFIVTSGGAPKSILTVDQVGGVWTAVSIGGADMSEAVTSLLARWPTSTSRPPVHPQPRGRHRDDGGLAGRARAGSGAVLVGARHAGRARPLRPERPASDQ